MNVRCGDVVNDIPVVRRHQSMLFCSFLSCIVCGGGRLRGTTIFLVRVLFTITRLTLQLTKILHTCEKRPTFLAASIYTAFCPQYTSYSLGGCHIGQRVKPRSPTFNHPFSNCRDRLCCNINTQRSLSFRIKVMPVFSCECMHPRFGDELLRRKVGGVSRVCI